MKTVFITGASGAIGGAAALAFARRGDRVALGWHSNRRAADALAEKIKAEGGIALCVQGDAGCPQDVQAMFSVVEQAYGTVDILVNSAGVSHYGLFTDMTLAQWETLLRTDLTSVFLCCQQALPGMLAKKSGCIINIGSVWGETGASCEAAYSAVKAAVSGLTKALAKEEGPSGIRVNCLAPGMVESSMNSRLSPEEMRAFCDDTMLQRAGRPEEIAKAAVFLAENEFITGQVLRIDGGLFS